MSSLGGTNPDGIILVWDLDQTLISGEDGYLNDNALKCMNRAFLSPNFSANFLLTNNSDQGFINMAHIALTQRYNELYPNNQRGFLFDVMYTASQTPNGFYRDPRVLDETVPFENRTPGHLAKRLQDVKNMLREIDFDRDLDPSRVFFFDDLPHHILRTELPEGHYILITPPFGRRLEDTTNYSKVYEHLPQNGGSRKKKRNETKKARKKLSRR